MNKRDGIMQATSSKSAFLPSLFSPSLPFPLSFLPFLLTENLNIFESGWRPHHTPLSLMISHELHGWHHSGGHGRPGFVNPPLGKGLWGCLCILASSAFPKPPGWLGRFLSGPSSPDRTWGVGWGTHYLYSSKLKLLWSL